MFIKIADVNLELTDMKKFSCPTAFKRASFSLSKY